MPRGFAYISLSILFLVTHSNAHGMLTRVEASDFDIYRLLCIAQKIQDTQDDQDFSLPTEIIRIITINAFKHRCNNQYSHCIDNPGAISDFISKSLNKSVSHNMIIAILKTCLDYTDQSLHTIKNKFNQTVLHDLLDSNRSKHSHNCIKIICSVAGDMVWDLITTQDLSDSNVLHWAYRIDPAERTYLFKFAPNREKLISAMNQKNNIGATPLHNIISANYCKQSKSAHTLNRRKQKVKPYTRRKTSP